jgi:hypothetical protein
MLVFNQPTQPIEKIIDTYFLHQSLFNVYDLNFGFAIDSLRAAVEKLESVSTTITFDDWVRYAAVAVKKGYGSEMLNFF